MIPSPVSLTQLLGAPASEQEADGLSSRLLAHLLTLAEPRMSDEAKAGAAACIDAGDAAGLAQALRIAVPDLATRIAALLPAA